MSFLLKMCCGWQWGTHPIGIFSLFFTFMIIFCATIGCGRKVDSAEDEEEDTSAEPVEEKKKKPKRAGREEKKSKAARTPKYHGSTARTPSKTPAKTPAKSPMNSDVEDEENEEKHHKKHRGDKSAQRKHKESHRTDSPNDRAATPVRHAQSPSPSPASTPRKSRVRHKSGKGRQEPAPISRPPTPRRQFTGKAKKIRPPVLAAGQPKMVSDSDPNYQTLAGLPDNVFDVKPRSPKIRPPAPGGHKMAGTHDPNYQTLAAVADCFGNKPRKQPIDDRKFFTY